MFDIIDEVRPWYQAGVEFAVATVTRTWSSAPRMVGAAMALSTSGEVIGSVSGGCVEGAVLEVCQEVLRTGISTKVQYGVSDDSAFEVGLTCGGIIEVIVRKVNKNLFPEFETISSLIEKREAFALFTIIESKNSSEVGGFALVTQSGEAITSAEQLSATANEKKANSGLSLIETLSREAIGLIEGAASRSLRIGEFGDLTRDDLTIFAQIYNVPPHMIVFGAIDFASAVANIGKFLGFYVTVCDARETFATKKRFPAADEVIVDWPHRYLASINVDSRTVICVLTHDPKFDIPALTSALKSPARYVGAMGSKRTHEDRLIKLREAGLSDAEIKRLRSPIGLDLNAHTPEETAVSIAAEIIADQWGASKISISDKELRRIHAKSLASEE